MNSDIAIHRIVVGELFTNCYIIFSRRTLDSVVIDPGSNPEKILAEIKNRGLKVKYIVNTHGHIDHIGANARLSESISPAPKLCIHPEDAPMLENAELNLAYGIGAEFQPLKPDILLDDGREIEVPGFKLQTLHTPGHTPGGICLAGEGFIFTGDTLFASGIGRTDFPGGDPRLLLKSIQEKLFSFDEATVIHPGHGPQSSIGGEKASLKAYI